MRFISLSFVGFTLFLAACGQSGGGDSAPDQQALKEGAEIYKANCAMCHDGGDPAAPTVEALQQMSADSIVTALTSGKMKQQGSMLSADKKQLVAGWLTAGQKDFSNWDEDMSCGRDLALKPGARRWLDRWGVTDDNHRFQKASRIDSGNVDSLTPAWSIAFPGAATMRSQPVIVGEAMFVAVSDVQSIYALDRESGCVYWKRDLGSNLRSALSYAEMEDGRPVLIVGDDAGGVAVVEANSGAVVWHENVGVDEFSTITGPVTVRRGTIYVPQSTTETIATVDPNYECCRASGAVSANRLSDGGRIWIHRIVRKSVRAGKTSAGTDKWGPAGASVWAAPVIDDARGLIYVGTGPISAPPDEGVGDSIIAIDMKSGQRRWSFQATENDLWNGACRAPYPGGTHPNCPGTGGVDYDFGAGMIRTQDANGRDMLIAGQKSGWVFALNPDTGEQLWKTRVGSGSLLGGVHWGMAIADGALFVPVNDPDLSQNPGLSDAYRASIADYTSNAGLYRLDLATGKVQWKWAAQRSCDPAKPGGTAASDCPPQYGLSGAVFAVGDVILSGAMDGTWRAFDIASGKRLFEADTFGAHDDTLNKVPGQGGSIDNSTLVAAGDMVFVQSGYGYFGGSPGNMLIAYKLSGETQ